MFKQNSTDYCFVCKGRVKGSDRFYSLGGDLMCQDCFENDVALNSSKRQNNRDTLNGVD